MYKKCYSQNDRLLMGLPIFVMITGYHSISNIECGEQNNYGLQKMHNELFWLG